MDLPELKVLKRVLQKEYRSAVTPVAVDKNFMEVELSGSWIVEDKNAHEGMFLSVISNSLAETLCERTEFLIYKLRQMSEARISSLT